MFLSGRYARLRPIAPSDYPILFRWSFTAQPYHRLARRREVTQFPDLASEVEAMLADSMVLMVVDQTFEPKGCAILFDVRPLDRHMRVDVYTVAECPAIIEMEAWLLLLDHVFAWFPVETLYCHLPESAESQYRIAMSAGFEEEGFLKESLWSGDRLWGVRILALSRGRWSQSRSTLIDNVRIQAQYDSLVARPLNASEPKNDDMSRVT